METISFKLNIFEGPLDLLVSLIGKKKIDVCDIDISQILKQYMDYLELMKEMDLEITSYFIVVASELIYIKSRMLLPNIEENADGDDPRASLVFSLNEYMRYKQSAGLFRTLYLINLDSYIKGPETIKEFKEVYSKSHEPNELLEAFMRILKMNNRRMPPPVTSFTGIVGHETYPVGNKISSIIRRLTGRGRMFFSELFVNVKSRSELVATFLAVLELAKSKKISVSDSSGTSDYILDIRKSGE